MSGVGARILEGLERESAALARSGRRAGARASQFRAADHARPSVGSSRPQSDRGTTFHFRHSYVSKGDAPGRGKDGGAGGRTPAAAHQLYIERNEAVEREGEQERLSFGTIGETRSERVEFWNRVEEQEASRGRVQCRIIAELPHELDAQGRLEAARGFCNALQEKGLPYWCVVHAPTGKNDRRNYHMHVAYYDRPANRLPDGTWDFEVTEEVTYSNRSTRTRRPLRQNKDRTAQGRAWITALRERFAGANSAVLEARGIEKRLDPRSYREAGVPKEPTIHLGPRAAALERAGVATRPGAENARAEILFRSSGWAGPVVTRMQSMEALAAGAVDRARATPQAARIAREVRALAERIWRLSLEVLRSRRREQMHRVAAEAAARRMELRRGHLERATPRLVGSAIRRNDGASRMAAVAAERELALIDVAMRELEPFVAGCRKVAEEERQRQRGLVLEQRPLLAELRRKSQQLDTLAPRQPGDPVVERLLAVRADTVTLSAGAALSAVAGGTRQGAPVEAASFEDVPTAETVGTFLRRMDRLGREGRQTALTTTRAAAAETTDPLRQIAHRRAMLLIEEANARAAARAGRRGNRSGSERHDDER